MVKFMIVKYFKMFFLMLALVLAPQTFPMESAQTNKTEIVLIEKPKLTSESFVVDFVYHYFLYIILSVLLIAAFIIYMLLKRDVRFKAVDSSVKSISHSNGIIQEVESYINYGRYAQAENALLAAIKQEQTNVELWELLLLVYAESHNHSSFEKSLKDIPEVVFNNHSFQVTLGALSASSYDEAKKIIDNSASQSQLSTPLAKVQHSTAVNFEVLPTSAKFQAEKPAVHHDEMQVDFNFTEGNLNQIADDYDFKNVQLIDDKTTDSVVAIDTAYSESTVENPNATKLDLVKAYIEMGNLIAARTLLDQVLLNAPSEAQARQLLTQLDSTS